MLRSRVTNCWVRCSARILVTDLPEHAPVVEAGLTSVVVVTADSGDGVGECIGRVLRSTAAVEVILVDNASRDGSVDVPAGRFPGSPVLRILRNKTNLGFGRACNRGVAVARGDVVLLLNPDCMIGSDTIARLRAIMRGDGSIGLVGAIQADIRGRVDPASRRRDPLLRRALLSVSGLARFAPRWPSLAGVELPMVEGGSSVEFVDAVSGALMALPKAVFEQLGGFDGDYFLHCEDLDLCRRVRDAGLRVACANAIRVVHVKGGSSRHRPIFVAWHKHRGMWRWFAKFDPAARNPPLRALVWCGIWAAFALKLPLLLLRGARTSN